MNFVKDTNLKGVFIPRSALKLSGFKENEQAALITSPSTVILLKKEMTAMDMVKSIESLSNMATELITKLASVCGTCDNCCLEDCPYMDGPIENDEPVVLQDFLKEAAGIPLDAKVCAEVNEEEGSVTFYALDCEHDLTDVPAAILSLLTNVGICMGELEEKLTTDQVIHTN